MSPKNCCHRLPQVSWAELIGVIRLLVTLAPGGKRPSALTLIAPKHYFCAVFLVIFVSSIFLIALFSGGTEAVWVLCVGVTVTAPGETHALDTIIAGGAALTRVISPRVTVTAGGERGLTLTILRQWEVTEEDRGSWGHLAHVSAGTEAVGILGAGVTVAAEGQTLALDAALVSRAGGILSRGLRVTWTGCLAP